MRPPRTYVSVTTPGHTLAEVAIYLYGSTEASANLCAANGELPDFLPPGRTLLPAVATLLVPSAGHAFQTAKNAGTVLSSTGIPMESKTSLVYRVAQGGSAPDLELTEEQYVGMLRGAAVWITRKAEYLGSQRPVPGGRFPRGSRLPTARATPDAVTAALRILVVGADCLAAGDLIPSAVVEAVRYCVPPVTGDWLAAVDAALRQIGRPFRVEPGGAALVRRFPAADGSVHMVEVRTRDERLLVLRSWPEDGAPGRLDGPGLRALNTLNGHLAAGCIVVDESAGEVSYRVELPLAWTMIDAALAEWLLTEAAERHSRFDAINLRFRTKVG